MNDLFNKYFIQAYSESYCTGVFSDTLDKLGYRHQVISSMAMNNVSIRMFGRIRTITLETVETDDERIGRGLGFLGDVKQDEVLVVQGSEDFAYFGELMTLLSIRGRLAGTVINGLTRDSYFTQTASYPIFCKGYTPVDIKGRGRVNELDVPIDIEGVRVTPGDYIFGDNDAIVIIPSDVFESHYQKFNQVIEKEEETKMLIHSGKSIEEILEKVTEF